MPAKALYAAFDLFPTSKGASTHIAKMAECLFDFFGEGMLCTLGNDFFSAYEQEGNAEIHRFKQKIPHYLDRAHAFSVFVENILNTQETIEVVHFRDIWSGLGIFHASRPRKTLFEVNGLPSIELPYRYPNLRLATLDKLRSLEQFCLEQSDHIVVPSRVIAQKLLSLDIPSEKISLVPNAAPAHPEFAEVAGLPEKYLLYFGALQSWQGIPTLFKAFAGLSDIPGLKLVICSSNRPKQTKLYRKMAAKLDIDSRLIWQYQLPKPVLNTWIKNALLTVAPLKECSRNIEQGCSPLKIYESMACGTAVVASDLPVTREIITPDVTGKLVAPDRPEALSRAIRIVLEYPDFRKAMGMKGQAFITEHHNWEIIQEKLRRVYKKFVH